MLVEMTKPIRFMLAGMLIPAGIALGGCETTPGQSGALQGGALGAAIGAGAGAIIGNQSGNAAEGALIGAGVGAVGGAATGGAIGRSRSNPARHAGPPPPPPPSAQRGYYETRIVTAPNGETYEERVWVPTR